MSVQVKHPIPVIAIFLWIGFVCAISFMEAWLKFHAPNVTLAMGLGIGRIVFAALHKVEWVLALTVFIPSIIGIETLFKWQNVLFLLALLILMTQTLWLLPALDKRAESHIKKDIAHPLPSCTYII
jgi:hypothetical protein